VADGITFSVKSFGVRVSGEPVAKKIMKGPWEGYCTSFMAAVGVIIPTVSPDRVFGGYIDLSWEDPPPGSRLDRGLTTGGALYKEPVVTVTVHGVHNFIQGRFDIGDSSGEVSAAVQQRLRQIE